MKSVKVLRTGKQCITVTFAELLQLSKSARQFSLSALQIKSQRSGVKLSRLLGKGMEFAENRRYLPGDDIRNIDWRVTARTGKVHTKLFAEEKEKQVILCADLRSSMFFATKGVFKSVQIALMNGYIAWNAAQTGNRLGGIIFDDTNHFEFRPKLGNKGLLPFIQQLADSAAYVAKDKVSALPTLENAIASLKRVATPGSFVFLMSDFRHLTSFARDMLLQISRHCDLCLCFIFDPFEKALPKNGYYPVSDGHHELNLNTYDKKLLEQYQIQFNERREKVVSLSHQRHVHFIECSTEDDCFSILKQHFS